MDLGQNKYGLETKLYFLNMTGKQFSTFLIKLGGEIFLQNTKDLLAL